MCNNNKSLDPLRAKKTFIRKKVGPYRGFGYSSLISDPFNLAKGARGKNCNFANFNVTVNSNKTKNTKIFQIRLENGSKRMIIFEFSEYIP